MEIPFTSSPDPTLGVEVELHLVDAETGALASVAVDVLDALAGDDGSEHPKAKHELFQSTVEIITGICTTPAEAVADLRATLDAVRAAAAPFGAVPMAAGTHPTSCAEDQRISPRDRYHALVEEMQWTARRLLICGTHFHVGVPSGEHAIAVMNEVLRHQPLLQILSASSPFFEGQDTGLASVRPKIFESLPTAGLPPDIADWADFQRFMGTLLTSGVIRSVREVWWDVRPHPELGTVELRMCDASPTLREVAALAALAQSLVADAVARYESGDLPPPPRRWVTRENRWLASRHGVHADLIATADGQRRPAELMLEELVDQLRPTADALGCREEVDDSLALWASGPSYLRQRDLVEAGATLDDVVDHLVGELRDDEVRATVPVDAGRDGRRTA